MDYGIVGRIAAKRQKVLPTEATEPEKSPIAEPEKSTSPPTEPATEKKPPTATETATVLETLAATSIKPSEKLVKKGYRVTESQDEHVKMLAAKYKVSESEIARIAFDYLTKNFK
jgi:hypothetical protein